MLHTVLGGGLQAGAIVRELVRVRAAQHVRNTTSTRLGERDVVELRLAVIAAVRGVRDVARVLDLVALDLDVRCTNLRRERLRVGALTGSERSADSGDPEHVRSERVVRRLQEERRVTA